MELLFPFLEAAALASSCSIDAFAASFAYGSGRIHIPLLSNQIINLVCSAILGAALLLGRAVRGLLPAWVTGGLCFAILFLLGLFKLLDGVVKTLIRRHAKGEGFEKRLSFSVFHMRAILTLYADPESADLNADRVISPGEAALLAVSLSLDGAAIGFGAALGTVSLPFVLAAGLLTNVAAIALGGLLGRRLAGHLPDVSWLGGAVLILLAVGKLL